MVSGSRLRQIGWAMALGLAFTGFIALTFRVNAVKSEVVRAERQIIALKHETMRLETEFETRASQQQLANWNAVDFGYIAPRADQYLESERQLAALAQPMAPGAPAPIRVAHAPGELQTVAMVSPLTGKPLEPASPARGERKTAEPAPVVRESRTSLAERLGMSVDLPSATPDFGPSARGSE